MKRKLFLFISAIMVLSLATAIFAFNQRGVFASFTGTNDKNCCAKKDSCPMKNHQAGDKKHSCPMKKEGQANADCCNGCKCCGDSCPMKKKEGNTEAQTVAASVTADSESCCGCDCCNKKKDS